PASSVSAWDIQLRRHDSLIPRSLARVATGLSPVRANCTARWRNSTGCGAGIDDILPGSRHPPHPRCPENRGRLPSPHSTPWNKPAATVNASPRPNQTRNPPRRPTTSMNPHSTRSPPCPNVTDQVSRRTELAVLLHSLDLPAKLFRPWADSW